MDKFSYYSKDQFTFIFEVEKEFRYAIEFSNSSYLLDKYAQSMHLFDISFNYVNDSGLKKKEILNKKTLTKIRLTIVEIMVSFMQKHKCSLIYICDSIDNRHFARHMVFKNWKKLAATDFIHITRHIELENQDYYFGSILFDKEAELMLLEELENPSILNK